jgi:hypothetical protein
MLKLKFQTLVYLLVVLSLLSITACTPVATTSPNSNVAPSEPLPLQPPALSAVGQDGESPSVVTDSNQETILTVASDNLLVIDTSNGKGAFPMPANERRFASNEILASFAEQHLAAKVIMNNAAPIAFTGQIRQIGTPTWWDARKNTLYEVADPVLAFLGGVSGRIWINDQPLCLDPDQLCDNTPASYLLKVDITGNHAALPYPNVFLTRATLQFGVLSQLDQCTADNTFCTQFNSFFHKIDLGFFKYVKGGANTKVTRGTAGETIQPVACDANGISLDAVVQDVTVTIQTGDDDLRGGNDNAFARLEYSDGTSDEFSMNDGTSWGNNSVNGKSFTLPSHRTLGDIVGFSIRTTFGGGTFGDNWNINQLLVEYSGPSGNGNLLFRQGNPFLRFTGDFQYWEAKLNPPALTADLPVDDLVVTIHTGNDDLRGGNDNAFAILSINGNRVTPDFPLNNGVSWSSSRVNQVTIPLTASTTLGQIQQFGIHTTFSGGIAGDNWDVDEITVEIVSGGNRFFWFQKTGSPYLRFTGQFQEWTVETSTDPAPMQCGRSVAPKRIAVTGAALVKLNHDPGTGAAGWDTIALNGAEARGQNAVEVEAWGFFLAGEIEAGGDIRPDLDAPEFELFTFEGICSAHQGDTLFGQTGNGDFEGALDAGLCPSS